MSSIPGLGRSPGEGNGNSLQYFCLEKSMDRGVWRATVDRVAKSQTRPSTHILHYVSVNVCVCVCVCIYVHACVYFIISVALGQTFVITIIQHSFGSPSHSNQRKIRNKRNPDWIRRTKVLIICR